MYFFPLVFTKFKQPMQLKSAPERDCKPEPIFIPASTASLVQPVDIAFNPPCIAAVEREAAKHLQENLGSYVEGNNQCL